MQADGFGSLAYSLESRVAASTDICWIKKRKMGTLAAQGRGDLQAS